MPIWFKREDAICWNTEKHKKGLLVLIQIGSFLEAKICWYLRRDLNEIGGIGDSFIGVEWVYCV